MIDILNLLDTDELLNVDKKVTGDCADILKSGDTEAFRGTYDKLSDAEKIGTLLTILNVVADVTVPYIKQTLSSDGIKEELINIKRINCTGNQKWNKVIMTI